MPVIPGACPLSSTDLYGIASGHRCLFQHIGKWLPTSRDLYHSRKQIEPVTPLEKGGEASGCCSIISPYPPHLLEIGLARLALAFLQIYTDPDLLCSTANAGTGKAATAHHERHHFAHVR